MSKRHPWTALIALVLSALVALPAAAQEEPTEPVEEVEVPHVVVFSGTYGFRHGSIEHSVAMLTDLAASSGAFTIAATEDPATFTAEVFDATDIILFANTTGETPFSDAQKAMFEAFILAGGGFMGIHAAADTNYEWPFYQELVGAAFESHPHTGGTGIAQLDEATVQVESPDHPIHADTEGDAFPLREEYYKWRENPRGTQDVQVLLSLDETTTYGWGSPPSFGPVISSYDDDQPVEWIKTYRGAGRVWYTNLGHYEETYDRAEWQARFLNAVEWVHEGHAPIPEDPEPTPSGYDAAFIVPPAGASTGFVPPTILAPEGSTGTLYNLDNVEHNVISKDLDANRLPLFRSQFATAIGGTQPVIGIPRLAPGDYEFYCAIHGGMEGTLTIV